MTQCLHFNGIANSKIARQTKDIVFFYAWMPILQKWSLITDKHSRSTHMDNSNWFFFEYNITFDENLQFFFCVFLHMTPSICSTEHWGAVRPREGGQNCIKYPYQTNPIHNTSHHTNTCCSKAPRQGMCGEINTSRKARFKRHIRNATVGTAFVCLSASTRVNRSNTKVSEMHYEPQQARR